MSLHGDMMVLIQLMIYSFFQCWVVIMHLSMWVASSLSTYVIPFLFNKNLSANISRSPFIKLIIYSTRFVIIKTFIKKIFASTIYTSLERSWSSPSLSQTLPTPLETYHFGWKSDLEQQSSHQRELTSSFSSECKGNVYINLPSFDF